MNQNVSTSIFCSACVCTYTYTYYIYTYLNPKIVDEHNNDMKMKKNLFSTNKQNSKESEIQKSYMCVDNTEKMLDKNCTFEII